MRQKFHKTGDLLTARSSPCDVGTHYILSYESGLRAKVELEKESGYLKLIEYKYEVNDPEK